MTEPDSAAEAERHCIDLVRRSDPERWLCALFAPPAERSAIVALLALNQELGRITEVTKEPMTALIRLQWWRDAVGPAPPAQAIGHPVIRVLRRALTKGHLESGALQALIDAREQELDASPPQSVAAMIEQARAIAGQVQRLTAGALGAADAGLLDAAERVGTAWGLVGVIRATRHRARLGRVSLPVAQRGLTASELATGRMSPALAELVAAVLAAARSLAGGRPPSVGPAAPAMLLRLPTLDYIRMIEARGCDPFRAGDLTRRPSLPARLLWAWLRAR